MVYMDNDLAVSYWSLGRSYSAMFSFFPSIACILLIFLGLLHLVLFRTTDFLGYCLSIGPGGLYQGPIFPRQIHTILYMLCNIFVKLI